MSATLATALAAVARTAARHCRARDARIMLVEGEQLRLAAHGGPSRPAARAGATLPLSLGTVAGAAVLDRRVVHVPDLARAVARGRFAKTEAPTRARGAAVTVSILAAPLIVDGRVLGAIALRGRRPFTASEIALLRAFADHAAVELQCARRGEDLAEALAQQAAAEAELEARNRDLTVARGQQAATAEILRVISSSPTDVQPSFAAIADSAARLTGAAVATLYEYDGQLVHLRALSPPTYPRADQFRGLFPRPPAPDFAAGRVILDRIVLHVADLRTDPATPPASRQWAEWLGIRGVLWVPLLREGTPIGVIGVVRAEAGRFSDGQVTLLETFAAQAVIAIENVRLFAELETRNRALTEALEQQTATAEILRVISRSPTDVQPVFEAIVASARALSVAAFSGMFLLDGDQVRLPAAEGLTGDDLATLHGLYPRPPSPDTVTGRAILERRVVHVPDLGADPDYATAPGLAIGVRTLLAVPMLREGQAVGAIAVWRTAVQPFSDRQVELLRIFADQAVIAIENVRLFTELDARNRALTVALDQQTATAEILRVINRSQTDVQPVFDAIAESSLRLCQGGDVAVFRFDGELLHLVSSVNMVSPEASEALRAAFPRKPEAGSLSGRAVGARAVVEIPDVLEEPDYPLTGLARATRSRSLTGIPLLRNAEPIGSIVVGRQQPGRLSADQVALLQTFADQAVIAIENVRLFAALQERNRDLTESLERQTATAEILRVISSSPTDTRPVFAALLRSAVDLSGSMFGVAYRYDGERLHVMAHHNMPPAARDLLDRMFPAVPASGTVSAEAVARREPVQVADATDEATGLPGTASIARAVDYRANISVPMLREGQPIGTITLARREPQLYTDKQVALLRTFADQAVIAIENVRLFTELGERNRALHESLDQQVATSEILQAISRAPTDLQPVFDAIGKHAVRLAGAVFGSVYRVEDGLIHMVAHHNYPPAALELSRRSFPTPPGRQTFTGRAILERRIVHVADVSADEERVLAHDLAEAIGFRSALSVPMLREGSPIGAITVWRAAMGPFPDNHVALLQTFADQAVIAIENARLLSELEGRNLELTESLEQQTATADILRVISEAHGDVQPVFEAIARSALRLLRGFSVGVVRVVGDRLDPVAIDAGRPGSAAAVREAIAQLPRRRGAHLWDAIIDREVKQIHDVEAEAIDAEQRARARTRGWRASIAVPMIEDGEPIGVIAVSREAPGAFSAQQVDLLEAFADQAAIAVKNARLLVDLQARSDELARSVQQLTALGEVGQAVSASLDLETVLTTIVTRAVQLTGVDDGVVFEYDDAAEEFTHRAGTRTGGVLDEARRVARVRKGEGVLGRTAITREPVQVADITQAGVYESRLRETLLASGVRALLAVPMLREGRLLGGLVLSRYQPGEFPVETVELLRTFAAQSALAIQNARLYRELTEQGRQLEVASRHKSEFLASMSHELRTPLNAILGFNEMILGDIYGEVPADLREPLAEMQNSGHHLLRLINNVLDLSKIEAGRMELSLADYSVQEIVERVRASLRSLAADKGLEFVTAVSDDLPLVHGDAGRVTQCLTNLAGNALKFTRHGRVEIGAALDGDRVVFRVSDTGIGIAPDKIDALFTEFRQGDAAIASEFGGTGLGLSITRKFVEMHGGRLWVQSELGKGSTFFLALPLRAAAGATA